MAMKQTMRAKRKVSNRKISLLRLTPLLFIVALLFLVALLVRSCARRSSKPPEPSPTPVPVVQETPAPTPVPTPQPIPECEITQAVAYYFPNMMGSPTLYGVIEYKNTGPAPCYISEAKFSFRTPNRTQDYTFTPMVPKDNVVKPGETATLPCWLTYDKEKNRLNADSAIRLNATLTLALPEEGRPTHTLTGSRLFLEDNYPNFSTLTGTLHNPTNLDYSIALAYLTFYDEENKLIGTWTFTKNIALAPDADSDFVVHLQALPLPGLSERVARIVMRGIGIE